MEKIYYNNQLLKRSSELRKNEKAYRDVFEKWNKPFLIANSDNDPVTKNNPRMVEMLKRIPSAEELIIEGPGHFIQEEAGPEYANLIINQLGADLDGVIYNMIKANKGIYYGYGYGYQVGPKPRATFKNICQSVSSMTMVMIMNVS